MHFLSHHQTDAVADGMQLVIGFAAVIVLLTLFLIFDKVEEDRFKRWRDAYGYMEQPLVPWRTLVPWHKTGSRWFLKRFGGTDPLEGRLSTSRCKDPYSSYDSPFGNRHGSYTKEVHLRGKGTFGDGRGNATSNYSSGPK